MESSRHCKRSCDLLLLSSGSEIMQKKFSGLTLLSPSAGHISEVATEVLPEEDVSQKVSSTQTKFSCERCQCVFPDLMMMRKHYQSPEHSAQLKTAYMRQISDEDYKKFREFTDVSEDEAEDDDKGDSSNSESSSDENEREEPSPKNETQESELEEGVSNLDVSTTSPETGPQGEATNGRADKDVPLRDHLLRHSKLYFRNADEEILAIHKCLLITKRFRPSTLDELLHAASTLHQRLRWALLMMSGGHFAGAIFDGARIVCHKTFQRYTTRQKQGGVQSGRDAQGGGRIRSGGASVRRYNEAALQREIQELLQKWRPDLDACSHIFLRAPARKLGIFQMASHLSKRQSNNANAPPGPAFVSDDLRIRSIPMTCKRPTFDEIKRIHRQLSEVEVYDRDARLDFISMSDHRQVAQRIEQGEDVPPRRAGPGAAPSDSTDASTDAPRPGPGRDARQRRRQRRDAEFAEALSPVAESGAADPRDPSELAAAWEEWATADLQEFDVSFRGSPPRARAPSPPANADLQSPEINKWLNGLYTAVLCGDQESISHKLDHPVADEETTLFYLLRLHGNPGRTVLHDAVFSDAPEVVTLLLQRGCNPELVNARGQTPYEVAQSKQMRNAFRRFMADHPDKFDYKKAKIPSPLTEERASEKRAREAERRRAARAAKRDREREKKAAERSRQDEEREREQFLRLSDREKRLVMVERRAVAQAEEKGLPPPVMIKCFQCADNLTARNRFEYFDNVFCSSKCLQAHRAKRKE